MITYCGRIFSEAELKLIKNLIRDNPKMNRTELSRQVCRLLGWYKPDNGLKDMSCRVAMLRMEKDQLIVLPASQRKKKQILDRSFTSVSEPGTPIVQPVQDLNLSLNLLSSSTESRRWNEYVGRYHYLGFKPLPGAQLRYYVMHQDQWISVLGFGAAAWQCAPRDQYIGWSHEQRKKNLQLIINNARYLIFPWVQSKNLASKVLSLVSKRIAKDWYARYRYTPVMMETFVEQNRFLGTCYKAANWVRLGETKGRGKLGPSGKISVPIKDIWVYPLDPAFKKVLQ